MRHISFFAGIGGFDLGLEWAGLSTPVAYSEIDPYACKVYEQHWPGIPNLGDLTTLTPDDIPAADMWCGGFPCQPFSVAGKRKGTEDERHLWPVWAALISEVRPRFLILENVPGLLTSEGGGTFNRIISDLAEAGYDTEWSVIGAYEVGAPHKRDRLWIWCELSDPNEQAKPALSLDDEQGESLSEPAGSFSWPPGWSIDPADVDDPESLRRGVRDSTNEREAGGNEYTPRDSGSCYACGVGQGGGLKSKLGRVAHGIPNRVDRLKCLGNAVVPQVVQWIGKRILTSGR